MDMGDSHMFLGGIVYITVYVGNLVWIPDKETGSLSTED